MSMNREASMGLSSTTEAVAFGQMHLSEGSPATTVITTNLDVSPGDAVEPCVSSLPDGQVRGRCLYSQMIARRGPDSAFSGALQWREYRLLACALVHECKCRRPSETQCA